MKRFALILLILSLFLAVVPGISQAQEAISASYDTNIEFPTALTFSLNAESTTDITQITLSYKISQITTISVISEVEPQFNTAHVVKTSWEWDMTGNSLPPGAEIQYSWRIEDAAGYELETPWKTVQFNDNRYHWKSLTEGKITLFWYEGDQSFARELMDSANSALDKLAQDTGAHLEQAADIYIYASSQDLLGALIFPQEWTGGVAFPEYGIIIIGIAPDNLAWGKMAMAHELAHLVTYQMTSNPYSDIPTWLNEGLSMYAEGPLDPTFESLLDKAISEDKLFSVQTLSSNFPADPEGARLSYAESYSLIQFLIQHYGQEKMLSLLSTFKQGSTYDNALEKVYGLDTTGLDNLWRLSLGLEPRQTTPTPQATPTPRTGFLGCREASAKTAHNGVAGLGALGILMLPVLGEAIRLRARRGKR
jgi:hypothetical protein